MLNASLIIFGELSILDLISILLLLWWFNRK